MGNNIMEMSKGQKPTESVKQTPQPVMSKQGFKMVEAAQAVDGNMTGRKVPKYTDPAPAKPGA